MKFYCAPSKSFPKRVPNGYLKISLYSNPGLKGVGWVGTGIIDQCRKSGLTPNSRAWDFLSLALSVVAADKGCSRKKSPDGWTREFELIISVNEPGFWNTQRREIEKFLAFLTGDIWKLFFTRKGLNPKPPEKYKKRTEDAVTLLSGGLDSLIGTIDKTTEGARLIAVSQKDGSKQKIFSESIGHGLFHFRTNHNAHPFKGNEDSQRSRSIVFFAFAILAATSLEKYKKGKVVDLYVPENGFISLNIPLTTTRVGSLSTRTTHPHFIKLLQEVLTKAGLLVKIINPYQFKTKGEMLRECKDKVLLKSFASITTSCGRYRHYSYTHCGRCVPCLIRRASFHKWNKKDNTKYKFEDLSKNDFDHKRFDDVRSAGIAIKYERRFGTEKWIGSSLNTAQLGDIKPYVEVAKRGLKELEMFLVASRAL